jgi:hypothetical protein
VDLNYIEKLEQKYLDNFYFSLKSNLDGVLEGLDSKLSIKDDWVGKYGGEKGETSVFDKGAERVIYSYLNTYSQNLKPNSAPVGSDLFFESPDAFIQVDLKTVSASLLKKPNGQRMGNIGDYKNIFVGRNQNSYTSNIIVKNSLRPYKAQLPPLYNKGKSNSKVCLSYFITLLFDQDTYETLVISIMCLPNGLLREHYEDRVIQAGKNPDKARFRLQNSNDIIGVNKFELLDSEPSRIKTLYFNHQMDDYYKSKLMFFKDTL